MRARTRLRAQYDDWGHRLGITPEEWEKRHLFSWSFLLDIEPDVAAEHLARTHNLELVPLDDEPTWVLLLAEAQARHDQGGCTGLRVVDRATGRCALELPEGETVEFHLRGAWMIPEVEPLPNLFSSRPLNEMDTARAEREMRHQGLDEVADLLGAARRRFF